MTAPAGFVRTARRGGAIAVIHRGRPAATVRGRGARAFLAATGGAGDAAAARLIGSHRPGSGRQPRDA